MSTSGSISYNLTSLQIIEKAFHVLGKASEGEALSARMSSDGLSSLNLFLKTLGANEHLWTKTERTVTLVADTSSYALTPKPGRVLSVRIRASNVDTALTELTREEYHNLPNKATSGTPTAWFYDPQTTTGTLYVYPPPSSAVASAQTLYVTYLRRIEDMVNSGDDLDMPQEWLEAIVWNLASSLETQYPVNDPRLAKKIDDRAMALLAILSNWDAEPQDTIFIQVPVIAEAFELIGKSGINAEDHARAKRTLDNLLGTWSAMEHLWTKTEGSITLVSGQASYTLSPKAQRVLSVRRRYTSGSTVTDIPLTELSRQEYFDLPNKTSSPSTPNSWYYDPQRTTGTVYVWPPADATTAANTTLQYTYLRVLASFDGTTLDLPAEWTEAVALNLAARLKLKYPMQDKERSALIDLRAREAYDRLKGWDTEPASLFMQPEYRPWTY